MMRVGKNRRRFCPGLISLAVPILLWLCSTVSARADTISLSGFVNYAGSNPFGITTQTPVTGYAVYDGTLPMPTLGGALNYWGDDPGMVLDFHVGSFSFNSTTDPFFDLTFGFASAGSLTNIALLLGQDSQGWGLDIVYDAPGNANVFSMTDPNDFSGAGTVIGQVAPVPLPGGIALLGSGLSLLVGLRSRWGKRWLPRKKPKIG